MAITAQLITTAATQVALPAVVGPSSGNAVTSIMICNYSASQDSATVYAVPSTTQAVTVSSSTGSSITLSAPVSLTQNQAVVFASSFGSVVASTIYYVYASTSASATFSISSVLTGTSAFSVGTGGTGSATIYNTVGTASNTNMIVSALPIPAGETVSLDQEKLVLGLGDSVFVKSATSSSAMNIVISTLPV